MKHILLTNYSQILFLRPARANGYPFFNEIVNYIYIYLILDKILFILIFSVDKIHIKISNIYYIASRSTGNIVLSPDAEGRKNPLFITKL